MKKKPITTEIIKNILDVYSKEDANLKDLRIAALCSFAFAGLFRYAELCNIVPNPGADPAFFKGGGVADYSRPSNYTLIYFKLP